MSLRFEAELILILGCAWAFTTHIMLVALVGSDYEFLRTSLPGYVRGKYRKLPGLAGTYRAIWLPRVQAGLELGIVMLVLAYFWRRWTS